MLVDLLLAVLLILMDKQRLALHRIQLNQLGQRCVLAYPGCGSAGLVSFGVFA